MISVLMSVFNDEKYIEKSIESIVNQTYEDLEIIIIDDGSTDNTVDIIRSFNDRRIRIIHNEKNLGLTKSLNKGLKFVNGDYVARMDADDICFRERFLIQSRYMDKHPEIMLSSCGFSYFGEKHGSHSLKLNYNQIKGQYFFDSVLPHPGFFFRKQLIDEGYVYDERFKYAQDYDFQVRVSKKYEVSIIPNILFAYRVGEGQISVAKKNKQRAFANNIRKNYYAAHGIVFSKKEVELLGKAIGDMGIMGRYELIYTIGLFYKIADKIHTNVSETDNHINKMCQYYIGELNKRL